MIARPSPVHVRYSVRTFKCSSICKWMRVYVRMSVRLYLSVCMRMCMCMCVYVYVWIIPIVDVK